MRLSGPMQRCQTVLRMAHIPVDRGPFLLPSTKPLLTFRTDSCSIDNILPNVLRDLLAGAVTYSRGHRLRTCRHHCRCTDCAGSDRVCLHRIVSVAATMRLRMSLTELQSHPAMLVTSTRAPLEPLPCERCEMVTSRSWLVGVVGIGSASALPVQS